MQDLGICTHTPIADEFAGARLGDVRRKRRLQQIAERAMTAPDVGFPRMVGGDNELEGLYRFFNTEQVEPDEVLEPHFSATFDRMLQAEGPVLVAHDTTDLQFGGVQPRKGLGPMHGDQQGFLAHLALAVLPGEARLPLGACGMVRVCRTTRKHTRKSNKSWYATSKDPERESLRWSQLVEQVEARRGAVDCIHLMDREGDHYDLLQLMLERKTGFVVRACHDRALATGGRLFAHLSG